MIQVDQLGKDDITSLTEIVEYMLEGCSKLQDRSQPRKLVEEWARKILHWCNDDERSYHAIKEDLNELKRMCEELLKWLI